MDPKLRVTLDQVMHVCGEKDKIVEQNGKDRIEQNRIDEVRGKLTFAPLRNLLSLGFGNF